MENIYSPPIGALFEPIAIAAQNGLAEQRAEQAGGRVMSALSDAKRNLRKRSEEHLRLAVLSELGRDQPSTVEPYKEKGGRLWSTLFVPVYRRVPWSREGEGDGRARHDRAGLEGARAQAGRAVAPAGRHGRPGAERGARPRPRLSRRCAHENLTESDLGFISSVAMIVGPYGGIRTWHWCAGTRSASWTRCRAR